ncbi:acid-sensing ion channel 2-like [Tigriopus californicus]|uniref:acid-sensing ion channel 2-like n=1 Tax=Tigriopus californicus TaxID=6832 RepID=UPI0027DA292B|nr:acid-sensing ion channel 2-like [Tigriopus californicus]
MKEKEEQPLLWFLGFTSIGGLSQHHATNWNISKAIWLVLFIGGTSATLTQLYSIMTTYFEYNVVTSVTNTEVQSLNFPAVTICNQNAVHCGNLKDLIWILNSTQSNDSQSLANLCQLYIQVNCPGSVLMTELFSNGYPSNNTVCNSDVARPKIDLNSEDKFFKLRDEFDKIYNTISPEHKMIIAHQPDKMFKRCTFQSIVDTSIHCQLLLNGTGKIYHPTYGYCYTFNSNIEGRSKAETAFAGPYYGFSVEVDIERSYYMRVSATQNEGIAVAIHPPDKDPLLATSAINVLTNTLTSIALKQMVTTLQAEPYTSNCSTSWNRSSMPSLEGTRRYHAALCQGKCLFDLFKEKCNCSLNHLYTISDSNPKRTCLVHTLDQSCMERGADKLTAKVLKETCLCPAECNDVFYEYNTNSVRWPSHVFWTELANSHQFQYKGKILNPLDAFEAVSSLDPNISLIEQYNTIQSHVESNFLKLQVYFADKYVTNITESKEFTLSGILSTAGGAISLWLGTSFIALFEFVELGARFLLKCGIPK